MKFSYNWIRELVDGVDVPAKELGLLITMKTAECESVEPYGAHLAQVVAARVLSVEPIAGSHNVKAVVDTGRYGVKTVVCGAPNCRVGLTTAYVPAGTALAGREIGKATVSGVESDGMLASGAELGIHRDNAGILEFEAAPGAPIPGCEPDWTIEIDNKSMTHRPDLWGHHGMAREVAAILRKPLREPARLELLPGPGAPIEVSIENFDLCPRYSALVVENVTTAPSPLWLQYRLQTIGLNPISNIVDVTNFVMAELAQPMHAFDSGQLHGNTIFVRPAREGECLVTLDEVRHELTPANLVIADQQGPIALAGVMGGLSSGIGEGTQRIVFESATFHPTSIRRTASALKMRTDASMRYEKSQDPVNTLRGLARTLELLNLVAPGSRVVGGLADCGAPYAAAAPITLPMDWLLRKLGRAIEPAEVRDILERLAFGVTESSPRVFTVSVPSWRATKDVALKDDLVEEVGRMIGYGSIPPQAPAVPTRPPWVDEERLFHRQVRAMVAAQGFHEVYNYSFVSQDQVRALQMDPADHLAVANPISSEQGLLRISLLPNILKNLRDNSRHFDRFRLFEIGREIHKQPEGLPQEIPHLMAAIYDRQAGEPGLLEVKRLAECLMPGAEVRPAEARPYEHPARTAVIAWRGETLGRLFELHPSTLAGRGAILDIDLPALERLSRTETRYQPIRRFPSSGFDLSVVAKARELAGEIQRRLAVLGGADLTSIEFVRQYSGPPLAEGTKSVSYRLEVAAPDRTLSAEDVSVVRARIIDGMRAQGYELRV